MKHKQLAALAAAGLAAAGLGITAAHANSNTFLTTSGRTVEQIQARPGNYTLTGTYTAEADDVIGISAVSVNCSLQVRKFGDITWTTLDTDRVWVGGDLQDADAPVFIESTFSSSRRFNTRILCYRGGSASGIAYVAPGGSLSATPN